MTYMLHMHGTYRRKVVFQNDVTDVENDVISRGICVIEGHVVIFLIPHSSDSTIFIFIMGAQARYILQNDL